MSAAADRRSPLPSPPERHDPAAAAATLLRRLSELGVTVRVAEAPGGHRLQFRPASAVPEALRAEMAALRGPLLRAALRERDHADRLADQLSRLVPYRTPDGRRGWVHPAFKSLLDGWPPDPAPACVPQSS